MASPTLETKIWLALKDQAELAAEAAELPVHWPNQNFTAPASGYIRVSHIPNVPSRRAVPNDASVERQGVLQLMLMMPVNQNIAIATEKGGVVAEYFALGTRMIYDDVRVKIERPTQVGQGVPTGGYLELPVMVQYRTYSR